MIFSETAPMNFSAGQNANGAEPDETVALWVNRLFELISYEGPLPNEAGDFAGGKFQANLAQDRKCVCERKA